MDQATTKVVLITGAAKRVGAVIARELHAHGVDVIIHYRSSAAAAQSLRRELEAARAGSVALVRAELNAAGAPEEVIAEAVAHRGRLDGLINNASAFYATKVGTVTREQWDELFGSNLKAPFFLTQAAAPHLREARGAVVNMADIYAERPLKGFPLYSMAKAGLVMMTKSLARELAPEVRVNTVAPGAILWPEEGTASSSKDKVIARTALKRKGEPEELARAVRFLLLESPYITGQVLAVDGGRSLKP